MARYPRTLSPPRTRRGRGSVLSCRPLSQESLNRCCACLVRSERQRNLRWATDVVLIENGALIYSSTSGTPPMPWRACKRRSHEHPALKRELALLRSSLAALTPSQPARLDEPLNRLGRASRLRCGSRASCSASSSRHLVASDVAFRRFHYPPSRHLDRPPVRRNGEVLILHVRRGAILMPARSAQ